MKLGRVHFEQNGVDGVPDLFRRIANNPVAKAAMLERNVTLLRRLTGYPIDKCRTIMTPKTPR